MAKLTGHKALAVLGFSQASLARMFEVDTATTNQWERLNRVGERMLGRVEFIPELKGKVTAAQLRPDLSKESIAASVANAKAWWAKEADKKRAKEDVKSVTKPKAAKAAKPAKKKAAAKKPAKKAAKKKVSKPATRAATTAPAAGAQDALFPGA